MVNFCENKRCHILDDSHHHGNQCEDLEFNMHSGVSD
jgi:hypothetical protein